MNDDRSGRGRHALAPSVLITSLMLGGCAGLVPSPEPVTVAPPAAQWQVALPEPAPGSTPADDLKRWWQQFNDPVLTQLIDAAQHASPTIAAAGSNIEQARATWVAGGAALLPSVDATASAARRRIDLSTPVISSAAAGVQAAWEIDLFGANRAGRDAAQARLDGTEASWHGARISVAAETASAYLGLRACEAQTVQAALDATSRAQTARLTGLAAKAGFQAPANADLARASAAQGNSILTQQRAQCDLIVKSLVVLTALPEPGLRQMLAGGTANLPEPAQIVIAQVPADALAQRPDLFAAERELTAAGADVTQAQAQRFPSVTLAGAITPIHIAAAGVSANGTVWSVGPVTVTVPVFDGGVRRANARAAQARYDAAASDYAARLRTAVREVEEALIALQATAARGADARIAADGFERSYRAVDARYQSGLGSLFDLEDARRSAVAAQRELIDLQRERVAAWIALYRALGGGWNAADATDAVANAAPRS